MTTLAQVIATLAEADDELTIHAEKPWTGRSRAVLAEQPEDGSITEEPEEGLRYFLEVDLAQEVAAAYPANAVDAVIYYAENDAYPPDSAAG